MAFVTATSLGDLPSLGDDTLPTSNWGAIASSQDGVNIVAARTEEGPIFYTSNSGASWLISNSPVKIWTGLAASLDGTSMYACSSSSDTDELYKSMDAGATWVSLGSTQTSRWTHITCNADGTKVLVSYNKSDNSTGAVYSGDSGTTLTVLTAANNVGEITHVSIDPNFGDSFTYLYYSVGTNINMMTPTMVSDNAATTLSMFVQGAKETIMYTKTSGFTPVSNTSNITAICGLGYKSCIFSTETAIYYVDDNVPENTAITNGNFANHTSIGSATNIIGNRNSTSTLSTWTSSNSGTLLYRARIIITTTTGIFRVEGVYKMSDSLSLSASIFDSSLAFTKISADGDFTDVVQIAPQHLGASGPALTMITSSSAPYIGTITIESDLITLSTPTLINNLIVSTGNAKSLASSANGEIVYVCASDVLGNYGYVYKSINSGTIWTQVVTAGDHQFTHIVCDQTGQYVAAAYGGVGGKVILSEDFGSTWDDLTFDTQPYWAGLMMNSTGTHIAVAGTGGTVQIAVNGVVDVHMYTNISIINAIAASLSNRYMILSDAAGTVRVSSDYGNKFAATSLPSNIWTGVAVDDSGQYMVAAASTPSSSIWLSQNFGESWTVTNFPSSTNWRSVAITITRNHPVEYTDVQICILALATDNLYTSIDGGATFTPNPTDPTPIVNASYATKSIVFTPNAGATQNAYLFAINTPDLYRIDINVPCLLKGTLVKTPKGPQPIETLAVGDFVLNSKGRAVKITETSQSTHGYEAARYGNDASKWVYKVPAGKFGAKTDLYITYGHRIFVSDKESTIARFLGCELAEKAEICEKNGTYTVYNLGVEDGSNLVVNGGCVVESLQQ